MVARRGEESEMVDVRLKTHNNNTPYVGQLKLCFIQYKYYINPTTWDNISDIGGGSC